MFQTILGGSSDNLNAASAEFNNLMGGMGWASGDTNVLQVMPTGGNISSLRIKLNAAPGAGKSYAFVLMVNNVASALTCTVSGTDTTAQDTANVVAVVAGDTVSLRCTPTGTPQVTMARWATIWEPTTAGESICLFRSPTYALGNRFTTWQASNSNFSATEGRVNSPMPTAGTWKKLYIQGLSAPGAGTSYTIAFRLGGATQALTVTVADAATTGNDAVNTVAVAPGNLVNMIIDPTGTPAGMASFGGGIVFVSDTSGESLLLGGLGGTTEVNPSTSAVSYKSLPGFDDWTTTEANAQSLIGKCTVKKLYVNLSVAPGAGDPVKSYQFDIRKNSADSGITVTVETAETTGYDLGHAASFLAGDIFGIKSTPANTPAQTWPMFAMVLETVSTEVPVVITNAMSAVSGTTATGHGKLTALNGLVTQHGHVWATTTNPTTADNKTENGALNAPAYFISALTGLTGGTGYYVRAYATNEYGTAYGQNVYFVADSEVEPGVGVGVPGEIWVEGDDYKYVTYGGVEKTLTGA